MGTKSTSGPSARERARTRRLELERARSAQSAAVELAQVGYFTTADKITAAHAKIDTARAALDTLIEQVRRDVAGYESGQRDLVGALVDVHEQPVDDVAILLDLTVTQVRTSRSQHRAALKATAAAGPSPVTSRRGDGAGHDRDAGVA